MKPFLVLAFSLALFVSVSNGAQCTTYQSQGACQGAGGCAWNGQSCECSSLFADFIFLVDSSGSIGSNDYQTEKNFVAQMITTILPADSGVGIIRFASGITNILTLEDSKSKTLNEIADIVRSMSYTQGSTCMASAVAEALRQFGQANVRENKRIFLVTDGQPTTCGDPCQYDAQIKATTGLQVIILGVGNGFSQAAVDCLVPSISNADDYIITIQGYDQSLFDNVLPDISDLTCPVTFSLKTVEVKAEPQDASSGTQFVEFYNFGSEITLSKVQIEGLFYGTLASDDSLTLPSNTYLVVYNGDRYDEGNYPSCEDCACDKDTDTNFCTNAIYVSCQAGSSTPCTFSGTGMDRKNWYSKIIDITAGSTGATGALDIETITYDSSFPNIPFAGNSYALKELNFDNQIGQSWKMSCNARGTPGDGPISTCTDTCTPSRCQSGNDTQADCDTDTNTCECSSQYYYVEDNVCVTVPPPGDCVATFLKNGTTKYIEYVWGRARISRSHIYRLTYTKVTGEQVTVELQSRVKDVFDVDMSDVNQIVMGQVITAVATPTPAGTLYQFSRSQDCIKKTLQPSPAPTRAPIAPTPSPTWETPQLYLGSICTEDRCGCNGQSFSCRDGVVDSDLIYESNVPRTFFVKKYPADYPFDINITYRILYESEIDKWVVDEEDTTSSSSSRRRRRRRRRLLGNVTDAGVQPKSGYVIIPGDESEVGFEILIPPDGIVDTQNYQLQLLTCDSFQQCEIAYPDTLNLHVGDASENPLNIKEDEAPKWLWWVIGALIIFLFLLAWLVYRYWWRNKKTKGQLQDTKNELDDAIAENELGFGRDLDAGDVVFNPIATGVPGQSKAHDPFSSEMAQRQQDAQQQRADVAVEKFKHREEFGQVAPPKGQSKRSLFQGGASRNQLSNDLSEPLLGSGGPRV